MTTARVFGDKVWITWISVIPVALALFSCGGSPTTSNNGCAAADVPAKPSISEVYTLDSVTISWDPVPNATSYNLHQLIVPNCTKLATEKTATKDDPVTRNITSPYVVIFGGCNTCTYFSISSVNGTCESEPVGSSTAKFC